MSMPALSRVSPPPFGRKMPPVAFRPQLPQHASVLRFGNTTEALSSLQAFEPVLQTIRPFSRYENLALEATYNERLTPFLKKQVRLAVENEKLSPLELNFLKRSMGAIEECTDLLFEYYSTLAIRHNIVQKPQILKMIADVEKIQQSHQGDPALFEKVRSHVRESITPQQVKAFQDHVQLPSADDAQDFLTLLALKLVHFTAKDQSYDFLKEAVPKIRGEAEELLDAFACSNSFHKLARVILMAQVAVFNHVPILPKPWFPILPLRLVRFFLHAPSLSEKDLLQFMQSKYLGRSSVNFHYPDMSYGERKKLFKPYEFLLEAAQLKGILLRQDIPHLQ